MCNSTTSASELVIWILNLFLSLSPTEPLYGVHTWNICGNKLLIDRLIFRGSVVEYFE